MFSSCLYNKAYEGPTADDEEKEILFYEEAPDALFVKITPITWNEAPTLRLELLGCIKPSTLAT